MVKSNSPKTCELFNLNPAAPNDSVVPPNLHEAFSLATVYGNEMGFSSYAANLAWQAPWWPGNILSNPAVRALVPNNASNEGFPNANNINPLTNVANQLSQQDHAGAARNGSNATTNNIPLAQHFNLSNYNNYLTPNFGSLLSQSSTISTTSSHNTSLQMPPSLVNTSNNPMLNSNIGITAGIDSNDNFPLPPPPSLTPQIQLPTVGRRVKPEPRSPRYSMPRASASSSSRNCECPNCKELTLRGLPIDKKSEKHSCHIAGCMKVYSKSSHLKAHLRWHNASRPSVSRAASQSSSHRRH